LSSCSPSSKLSFRSVKGNVKGVDTEVEGNVKGFDEGKTKGVDTDVEGNVKGVDTDVEGNVKGVDTEVAEGAVLDGTAKLRFGIEVEGRVVCCKKLNEEGIEG
jgi:hypothetical protein